MTRVSNPIQVYLQHRNLLTVPRKSKDDVFVRVSATTETLSFLKVQDVRAILSVHVLHCLVWLL